MIQTKLLSDKARHLYRVQSIYCCFNPIPIDEGDIEIDNEST